MAALKKRRKLTLKFTPMSDGRVCKRVDGRLLTWPDEAAGRRAVVALIAAQEGGRPALPLTGEGSSNPPLRVIANAFQAQRKPKVAPGTWEDYQRAIDEFVARIDKTSLPTPSRPTTSAKSGRAGPTTSVHGSSTTGCSRSVRCLNGRPTKTGA